MKKALLFVFFSLLLSVGVWGQQDIYHRSDCGTNNWWDSNNPWYYNSWGNNQNRPDNDGRGNVNIGHNNFTTMNVNGAWFYLRLLSINASSTVDRIFNRDSGGGISLSNGIYNNSSNSLTFNVPIGVDDTSVYFSAISGNMTFTDNIYLNSNTGGFSGSNNIIVSGIISGTGGNIIKSDSGYLTLSGTNTYSGNTTINGGTLEVTGTVSSTTSTITVNNGGTLIVNGTVKAQYLVVNSGGTVLVKDGFTLEIVNTITNNGTITVENNASILQTTDGVSNSGSGTYNIQKKTATYNNYGYFYWSSPVTDADISTTFSNSNGYNDYKYKFVPENYLDVNKDSGYPQPTAGTSDGYDDDGNDWLSFTSGTMTPGLGYIVMGQGSPTTFNSSSINSSPSGTTTVTDPVVFTSASGVNNGVIDVTVKQDAFNSGSYYTDSAFDYADAYNTNINLLGNPYPSALNLYEFYSDNSSVLTGDFYVWTQQSPALANTGGPNAWDYSNSAYLAGNTTGAGWTAVSGGPTYGGTPSQYLPSCESFMVGVKHGTSDQTVTFNNSQRVAGNNGALARMNTTTPPPMDRVWLNMTGDNDLFRQIAIGFYWDSEDGLGQGDTPMIASAQATDFYSLVPNALGKYAIQFQSTFTDAKTVDLGITIQYSGNYTIDVDHFDGANFDSGQPIYLEDNYENIIHNLSDSPYSFTQTAGENINDRFILRFTAKSLDINETPLQNIKLYPNPSKGIFYIHYSGAEPLEAEVFDLLGKRVFKASNPANIDISNLNSGIYLAKFSTPTGSITRKIVRE